MSSVGELTGGAGLTGRLGALVSNTASCGKASERVKLVVVNLN